LTGWAPVPARVTLVLSKEEPMLLSEDQDVQDAEALSEDEVDELLVEEVSIDGMCGVY
jgi:mycofactocin precursor